MLKQMWHFQHQPTSPAVEAAVTDLCSHLGDNISKMLTLLPLTTCHGGVTLQLPAGGRASFIPASLWYRPISLVSHRHYRSLHHVAFFSAPVLFITSLSLSLPPCVITWRCLPQLTRQWKVLAHGSSCYEVCELLKHWIWSITGYVVD